MNRIRFITSGAILLTILAVTFAGGSAVRAGQADGLDRAMNSFIDGLLNKDKKAVLSFFTPAAPWKYQPYDIDTGKPMKPELVKYADMAKDFSAEKYWYHFFFEEPNGYTFQVNFKRGVMWNRKGADTFVHPEGGATLYIKWRREGSKWFIAEIGETVV